MAPRQKKSSAESMKSPDALDRKILAYAQEKAEDYAQQQKPAPMFGGRWYSLTASACVLMLAVIIIPGQWSSYMIQSKSGPSPLALEEDRQIQLDDAGVAYNSVEQGEPSMSLIAASSHDEVYDEVLMATEPEAGDGPSVNAPAASVRHRARSAPVAMKESVARKSIEEGSSEQNSIVKKKSEIKKELYAKRKARVQHKREPIREKKISAPKVAELGDAAPAQNDSMPARSHVVEEERSGRHTSAMMAPTINPNTRKVIAIEEVLVAEVPMQASPSPNLNEKIETLTRIEFNEKFDCQLDSSQWKELQRVSELWKSKKAPDAKVAYSALKFDSCNLLEEEVHTLTSYNFK